MKYSSMLQRHSTLVSQSLLMKLSPFLRRRKKHRWLSMMKSMALFKMCFFQQKSIDIFLLHQSICNCYGYSVEVSQQGTSNEYSQHILSQRNKKIYLSDNLLIKSYVVMSNSFSYTAIFCNKKKKNEKKNQCLTVTLLCCNDLCKF